MPDEASLVVYEKPTCTTCGKLGKLLKEEGVDVERVNDLVDPLSEARLRELLGKAVLGRPVERVRELFS